jgi:biopolymer transport protein ExbD
MAVSLRRPPPRRSTLSVVSMIDVMMILLFFFMITSSYLNLDMVPALQKSAEGPGTTTGAAPSTTLLIRINAQGQPQIAGKVLSGADLSALISARIATDPLTPVVLFPSGAADLQSLITLMDRVTAAGATRVKVIRIEAQP